MPEVRQSVLAGLHRLHGVEDRSFDDGQGHDAVASSRGEDHLIGASCSIFLTGIAVREGIAAHMYRLGACRVLGHIQGHHHGAVAAIHRLVRLGVGAGGGHRHAVIDIRQGVGTSGHSVIMQVGRVDRQRQGHDGVTAIGLLFHDVIDTGSIVAVVGIIYIRQSVGTDGDGFRSASIGLHVELHMPDAVAAILGLQGNIIVASLAEAMRCIELIRKSALAYGDNGIFFISRMYHQGEVPDAVTAGSRLQIDGIITCLMIGEFRSVVPDIRELIVADLHRLVEAVGRIDGKVEFHDAVAALDRLEGMRIMTARRQGFTSEHIGEFCAVVAQGDGNRLVICRKHCQMQGKGAVAAMHALQVILIGAGNGEVLVMPCIRSLVGADGHILFVVIYRIDGQGEVHGAVTAIGGGHHLLISEDTILCRYNIKAVGVIGLALADLSGQVGGRELVNGQVQDYHTVTAIGSHQILGVEAGGVLIESVLRIGSAFADMSHNGVSIFGSHREIQGHDAVATIDGLQIGRVSTRLGQCLTIERVRSRRTDGRVDGRSLHGVHRQGQGRRAVTSQSIGAGVRQGVGACHHSGGVKAVALVTFTGTHLALVSGCTRRVNGDDQRHQTVTTVRRGLTEHDGVFTRCIIGRVLTMVGVGRSLTDHIGEGDRFIHRMDGDLDLASRALAGGRLVVIADKVAAGSRHIVGSVGVGGGQRSCNGVVLIPAEGGIRC